METDVPTAGARRFGAYLKRNRENRGLSLDAVEEMTTAYPERVTKSHLSRIENGRAVPTFPRLIALGQVYGVPSSRLAERYELEFVRDAAPPEIADRPMDAVIEDVRGLRHSGRYADAYGILGALLDRERSIRPADDSALVDLRLQIVSQVLGRRGAGRRDKAHLRDLSRLPAVLQVL